MGKRGRSPFVSLLLGWLWHAAAPAGTGPSAPPYGVQRQGLTRQSDRSLVITAPHSEAGRVSSLIKYPLASTDEREVSFSLRISAVLGLGSPWQTASEVRLPLPSATNFSLKCVESPVQHTQQQLLFPSPRPRSSALFADSPRAALGRCKRMCEHPFIFESGLKTRCYRTGCR